MDEHEESHNRPQVGFVQKGFEEERHVQLEQRERQLALQQERNLGQASDALVPAVETSQSLHFLPSYTQSSETAQILPKEQIEQQEVKPGSASSLDR